jgi:ABC-2 type transport system ATP-binding protein
MPAPLLRLTSVSRTLGGTRVLDGVSLDVEAGSIVGLLGPNGAGKTTLVRLIMGLTRPDEGSIDVRAATVGYLPEERGLYQRPRVGATLTYLARLKGLNAAEADLQVARWLARVEMTAFASRRVEQLSKGQQQKIQLAAAFIGDPALLVLDEPFSGLDPLNARLVCDLVTEAAGAGRGVLVSAHQLALVEQVCTSVVMLARGRVALAGTLAELRRDHPETLEQLFVTHAAAGGAS